MASFSGDNDNNREVVLISGDSEEFRVAAKVASMSNVINNILGEEDQDEEKRVPLPNVNKEYLAKVLEFCNHYAEEPMTEIVKVSLPFSVLKWNR
jgi:S-phase kinase-associated protein 1